MLPAARRVRPLRFDRLLVPTSVQTRRGHGQPAPARAGRGRAPLQADPLRRAARAGRHPLQHDPPSRGVGPALHERPAQPLQLRQRDKPCVSQQHDLGRVVLHGRNGERGQQHQRQRERCNDLVVPQLLGERRRWAGDRPRLHLAWRWSVGELVRRQLGEQARPQPHAACRLVEPPRRGRHARRKLTRRSGKSRRALTARGSRRISTSRPRACSRTPTAATR